MSVLVLITEHVSWKETIRGAIILCESDLDGGVIVGPIREFSKISSVRDLPLAENSTKERLVGVLDSRAKAIIAIVSLRIGLVRRCERSGAARGWDT